MLIKWTTRKKHKFLERYNLTGLKSEEVENVYRPITSTEFETVVKTAITKGQDKTAIYVNSIKHLEKS